MMKISNYPHEYYYRTYSTKEKEALLKHMKSRKYVEWASTKKITDKVTGNRVDTVCHVIYTDGRFEWTSAETYMLEQYDIMVSDEFIEHVMSKG